MKIAVIIPTGIGCEIGGHAGDANPVIKLLGSCCDTLITHPNAVNASDINEMPENALYVEGSLLDSFLENRVTLHPVYQNRILLAVNGPVEATTLNSVHAARRTIGATIEIIELEKPLKMRGFIEDGVATGTIEGASRLCDQVRKRSFDALAVQSLIEVDHDETLEYLRHGTVNPWGAVEARLSRQLATAFDCPVAHAPFEDPNGAMKDFDEEVDARKAAECVSVSYLHCILKGLHRAPRINQASPSILPSEVNALVSPHGCWGRPHEAAAKLGIPIIVVNENTTALSQDQPGAIFVENYLEAAGLLMSMRAGVSRESVSRIAIS